MKEILEMKVKDLSQDQAFFGLFYTLVNKNDYYKPIIKYAEKRNRSIEEVIADIKNYYEDYHFASPYKYLDNICNYIKKHENSTLEISEILDCVPEYDWD